MKNFSSIVIIFLLIIITADSLDAQRRRSRRNTEDTEQKSFAEKINYEIRIGAIGFGGGFAMGVKPSIGFNINEYITLGGLMRVDYEFVNQFGFEDVSLFSYGPGILGRGKIMKKYYVQAEYTFFSFENINDTRFNRSFLSAGIGLVQGGDKWKYNIELMIILDDLSRDYFGRTVDFWINFSKNF
ncbi:MAG: hypothetical protein HKN68_22230 [Saprospiraceae bacterium]|nr:hypothetical protein [Saprospiraceae bacterium]